MHDLAIEQIGDGREPDMRMRADVDTATGEELRRTHLIEENEGADHLPFCRRQRAAHLEPAEVVGAWNDDVLDRVTRLGVARDGIVVCQPAHRCSFLPASRMKAAGGKSR